MAEIERGLGWLPDPPKAPEAAQDWDASQVLGVEPVPVRADNWDLFVEFLNQGRAPSCVAHAVLQALRAEHVRQGHAAPPLGSRLWAWLFSRALHGAMDQWTGTYIRTLCEALNRQGICAEHWWPYRIGDEDKVDGLPRWRAMPSSKAHQMAHDQKEPVEYRRIRETGYDRVDAVKRALGRRKWVVWGTDVTRRFVRGDYTDNEIADPPGPHEEIAGGHAMALASFEQDDYCEGPQTYGPDYWLDGRYRVSMDYIASALSRDFWIVEQVPIYSELEVRV